MAFADGTIVFLDLAGDRYCALTRRLSTRLADELRRGAPLSDDVIEGLRAARVLADGEGSPLAFLETPAPAREVAPIRALIPALLGAALCRRRAAMMLRRRHISVLISERRTKRRHGAVRVEEIMRKAAAFAGSRPLTAARNACLRETLALLLYLGSAGAAVDWVFAVKGAPFAAHCWAQLGEVVLNDSVDHARGYRPIMVV